MARVASSDTQAVLMYLQWTVPVLDKRIDPQFRLWDLNYEDVSLPCDLENKIVCSIQRLEGHVVDSQLCSKIPSCSGAPFVPLKNQERTWHHMFYECPGCIKKHGEVLAVWAPCLGQFGMEHFRCRGLVPRHWNIAPPIADEGLVAVSIFHDHNVGSGATILLGTDGSGGPFSDDPVFGSLRGLRLLFALAAMRCLAL
ncbi:unnamed protein product [Durusdinium trenchii]|uniref:Uncharacterized protein n=1 Tax=Durusdinium trenchii TaxID=1381693 RepID=A0ABP0SUB4_9DINO